jgi:hypothetical protein
MGINPVAPFFYAAELCRGIRGAVLIMDYPGKLYAGPGQKEAVAQLPIRYCFCAFIGAALL